jgi:LysM repeat protein
MKSNSPNAEMIDGDGIEGDELFVDLEADSESDGIEDTRIVTIEVRRGESVRLYEKWSTIPSGELKALNDMKKRRGLRIGQVFKLMLSPAQWRAFKEAREDHFTSLEKDFFAKNEVVRLDRYIVRRGDNIWKIAKLHNQVPVWLLEKFNANMNLAKLSVGEELLVPVLQDLAGEGDGNTAVSLWNNKDGSSHAQIIEPLQIKAARPAFHQAGPNQAKALAAAKIIQEPSGPQGLTLKVARNETLGHYSRWSGVPVRKIVAANRSINPNVLGLGQRVRVPVPDSLIAKFYDRRRRFNGTPPPVVISPVKSVQAVAVDKPAPMAKIQVLQTADLHELAAKSKAEKKKAKPRFGTHTVSKGESGWLIANKLYKLTLKQLKNANPNANLDRLQIGQVLRIPESL